MHFLCLRESDGAVFGFPRGDATAGVPPRTAGRKGPYNSTGGFLLHHHTAIDGQHLARDVFRIRGSQKGDRRGDVFHFSELA
jgi:hypothetical protein